MVGDRKTYAGHLIKFSSEKLAIIALTELIRVNFLYLVDNKGNLLLKI